MTGELTLYAPDGKTIEVGMVWKFEPFEDGSIAYKTSKETKQLVYTRLQYIFRQSE